MLRRWLAGLFLRAICFFDLILSYLHNQPISNRVVVNVDECHYFYTPLLPIQDSDPTIPCTGVPLGFDALCPRRFWYIIHHWPKPLTPTMLMLLPTVTLKHREMQTLRRCRIVFL